MRSPFWLGEKLFGSITELYAEIKATIEDEKEKSERARAISASNRRRIEEQDDAEEENADSLDTEEGFTIARIVTGADEFFDLYTPGEEVTSYPKLRSALEFVGFEECIEHFENELTSEDLDSLGQGGGLAYTPGSQRPFRYLWRENISQSSFRSARFAISALE